MQRILGTFRVAAPGTLVRVTSLLPNPAEKFAVHGILIQACKANTGRVYIGGPVINRTTEDGVTATLAIPTANSIPSFSEALTASPNGINAADFYIDADQPDDGVKVTVLIA
jgi:hypothetical protein